MINYNDMNDEQKQNVVDYINRIGVSIRQASIDLNMTTATINKIYTEKFGKKEREISKMKEDLKKNMS